MCTVGGIANGIASTGNSMELPQKIKNRTTTRPIARRFLIARQRRIKLQSCGQHSSRKSRTLGITKTREGSLFLFNFIIYLFIYFQEGEGNQKCLTLLRDQIEKWKTAMWLWRYRSYLIIFHKIIQQQSDEGGKLIRADWGESVRK